MSQKASGQTPELLIFETNIDLIDSVTKETQRLAKVMMGKGREVAILCANVALFDTYRKAGRIRDRIVAVDSRDDLKELRYSRSRCIFSMPEYVAGLQFEIVFLIHLDNSDVANPDQNLYQWRQHLSRAYLGSTRAKSQLYIACLKERGGGKPCNYSVVKKWIFAASSIRILNVRIGLEGLVRRCDQGNLRLFGVAFHTLLNFL